MPAEAKVRLSVQGAARVRGTLRGVRRDSERSSNQQQRDTRETARTVNRAENDKQRKAAETDRLMRAFSKGQVQEARRAAREQVRINAKMQKERVREAERAARREERLRRRLAEQSATGGGGGGGVSRLGRLGAPVAGALAGGIAGAVAGVNRARGIAGIQSLDQRIQSAAGQDVALRRLGIQAGLSDVEREDLSDRLTKTATAYGMDRGALLGGIAQAQERFGQEGFEALSANLEEMAKLSASLGVPLGDVVGMLGTFQTAMGLTADEVKETTGIVVAAARDGAVEIEDFSRAFAGEIGSFAQSTGAKGVEGVRQFVGAAQAIGSGQFGADESATRLRALVASLSAGPSKRAAVKFLRADKSTRDVGDRLMRGESIDILEVARAFASREDFSGAKQAELFSNIRGLQGIQAIVAREREGSAVAATRIAQADAATGQGVIEDTFKTVSGSKGFKFAQKQAEAQALVVENLDSYADQVLASAEASLKLEKMFGSLALQSETLTGMFQGLGLTLAAKGLLGGGGGGPAAAVGGSWGAASKLGKLGIIGQVIGTGVGAYGLTKSALELTGMDKLLEDAGSAIGDFFHGGSIEEQLDAKLGDAAKGNLKKREEEVQRQTLRTLKNIERNTQAKPGGGGAEPRQQPDVRGRGGR